MVESKVIGYHPEHAVAQVNSNTKQIQFTNGASADFDFLVYVPSHHAPQVVMDAGLTGESDWAPVDKQTLETKFPCVYAVGDVTGIMLSLGKLLPKAGVFAHGEAVANNLIHDITGKGSPRSSTATVNAFWKAAMVRPVLAAAIFCRTRAPGLA